MADRISIQVMRLPGSDDIPLPAYESADAAGMDVRAAVVAPTRLEPGQVTLIPSGFAIALPAGYEAQLRPRSGLAAERGITLVNSPGTIDSDYRGEIVVALINLGADAFEITRGLRIAQMVIAPVLRASWDEVLTLEPTARGSQGIGHTDT